MRKAPLSLPVAGLALALAACGAEAPAPEAVETEVPEELQSAPAEPAEPVEAGEGTPMEDRVATIGLLNKRNNISQDLDMKPGESRRIGDVIVRMSACERTAPWEMPQETGAFVQVLVEGKGDSEGEWEKVFSGWLFKRAPSLNVVEHPVYDVWVKECAMRFPGEPSAPASETSSDSEA
ncbi:DUF2155 domain-containing protein [Parerythrobacter jejuensis]|uniref:DUF2155 domain-containing protein n=1 Tax=Parerythrobacter jejuensis TaxID=795812 RepID=A0A845AX05_9SPHN|nr:DUF2155 domain-containing protein [Parerythrobacter jejuensis]MXP31344.1 DUF2155 domain-containing protein [Parerythrobacter jejuensis]MXP34104.1 DUF2155 domain-containing protein [Parerythrobacter jejuensis]